MTIRGGRDFFEKFLADFWQVPGARWPNLRIWERVMVETSFYHHSTRNIGLLLRNQGPMKKNQNLAVFG